MIFAAITRLPLTVSYADPSLHENDALILFIYLRNSVFFVIRGESSGWSSLPCCPLKCPAAAVVVITGAKGHKKKAACATFFANCSGLRCFQRFHIDV